MFKYLTKIELKQSIIYYFFLFFFFSFWNLFFLFSFYFYSNIQNILYTYQDRLSLNILVFSEKDFSRILSLGDEIKRIPYVKDVTITLPDELVDKIKNELPSEILENFPEEELKTELPYILKIYPLSIKDYPKLKNQINLLTRLHKNIQISEPIFLKLIYYAYFIKLGFIIFIAIWSFSYVFFLYFFNNLLNLHFKNQTQIFLLLGGSIEKIKLLRFLFLTSTLMLAFGFSTPLFFFAADYISPLFPFFKTYPDLSKIKDILYLSIYIFSTIFLFPWISILISYKDYEI